MILKNKGNCSLGDWWGMAKINKKLCFLSKMKKILIFPAESLILSGSQYFRNKVDKKRHICILKWEETSTDNVKKLPLFGFSL